jgi:hypothetical protein
MERFSIFFYSFLDIPRVEKDKKSIKFGLETLYEYITSTLQVKNPGYAPTRKTSY